MISLILISFKQIAIMAILILVGMICYKTGMVNHDQNKALSSVMLNIVMPVIIFKSYLSNLSPDLILNLGWAFVIILLIHIVMLIIARITIRHKNNPDHGVETLALIYSNSSFIGIPLLMAVLGESGVFFVTAQVTVSTIFFWTHGYITMSGEGFHWGSLKKSLTTPAMFAIYAGILCMVFRIELPYITMEVVDSIADMNTPLAMFVAGISIAQTDLKAALKKARSYYIVFLKLIVIPTAAVIICIPFSRMGLDRIMLSTLCIATACPIAASCTMIANYCNKDDRYSSELFGLTTLASALTLPLIISMTVLL